MGVGGLVTLDPTLEHLRDERAADSHVRESRARRDRSIDDWRRLADEAEDLEQALTTLLGGDRVDLALGMATTGHAGIDTIDRIAQLATAHDLAPVQVRRIDGAPGTSALVEESVFEAHAEGRFRDIVGFLTDGSTTDPSLSLLAFSIRSAGTQLIVEARFARIQRRTGDVIATRRI